MAQPRNLAPNLWIVDQPDFSSGLAKDGTRMTVIKLASGGLFLHSPTKLDDETKQALDATRRGARGRGTLARASSVRRRLHQDVAGAKLYGPPGLVGDIKDFRARIGARPDLKLDAVLGDEPQSEWAGELDQHLFKGARWSE